MINDEKAKEILDEIFNRDKCISRIKEITKREMYYGISEFLSELLLEEMWLSYVYGSFAGCVILSGVAVETALTEELVKKGYSKKHLGECTLEKLIDSAERDGIIKETAGEARKLKELRNKYVHPDIKEAVARAKSPILEGLIHVIERKEKEKPDAKGAIEKAYKILLEIYSEQRYPLEEL